ncbi:MAG: FAD-binding and (Fe-S)-binding domain-containing protein [Thiomicrorhabdus chilensis]|uniref:FAD-binding and (Fe-S)-binding domain-containing protein n=1 Tax=Thiomicrorhabdus chilensis TaxID=63656 RepID=UPI00299DACF2|nr:FAD-binding and (Fe-S)-binding domain-containing protein [Thiomicrorhabdus chilensis]MDX1347276.1 FAD-binding and (Fe-S)-binding domain-containing protein [Thiomicrorhabdus chilensis]
MPRLTDASVYELQALEIDVPDSQLSLVYSTRRALLNNNPITLRAGGTSLGGQATGSGTLIDVSKHLTKIIAYRPKEREVDVEPGVIQDDLNDFLKADGLRFAPDTSTSNRAMIGGMIGNNSCGSYSVYYGTTREHVKSVDVILADGSETTFGSLSDNQLQQKLNQQDFEGNIYRTVFNLLERHGKTILEHFPHPSIKRRNTGYALDELYRFHQPFNPKGKPFNLAPLICGSEGTLAVIKQACLNLVELPKHRQLLCAHFDSIEAAMKIVPHLLEFEPAAIELIDKATLDGAKANRQQQQNRFWIEGDPQAVLVIELFDDLESDLKGRLQNQQAWLLEHGAYAVPIIEPEEASRVWEVRKAGLGMLMGKITRKKAVAVIEDAAVPVRDLFEYFQDVQSLMAELQVGCVYYGHASVGLIHIRPELDLATAEGKELFQTIAERNSKLVKKYRGALSGEHGDGRIRAPFLKEQMGEQVYAWLKELKYAFDPHNLLNPGVIISDTPITENLRADRQPQQRLPTAFDWTKDMSLMDAVEKCNGAGACRKSAGRGVMCPSYQATREENYSTRGRSNLLRYALTEPDPRKALNDAELQDALALCLGCKACKTECPANVDMARLKAEVLHQTRKFFDLSDWAIKHYAGLLNLGQKWPRLFNAVQSLSLVKKALGVDVRRKLPQAHSQNLKSWWLSQKVEPMPAKSYKVWVLVDLFSQFQEPQVGQAVLRSLSKMGLQVEPLFLKASPRALISQGLLPEAKQALLQTVQLLKAWQAGDYIVGIEPSELLVWRDEAHDLLKLEPSKNEQAYHQAVFSQVLSYEELILQLSDLNALAKFNSLERTVWLHVHCHQKALAQPDDSRKALQLIPGVAVEVIPSGCCGMSGEFGYKHYEVSRSIAEQTLLPTLESAKDVDWIVATGTSCRHQLADFGQYSALHIAQVFDQAMD